MGKVSDPHPYETKGWRRPGEDPCGAVETKPGTVVIAGRCDRDADDPLHST